MEEIVDSPLAYHPADHHIPGYPANPRMMLARLYLQLGVFLDYYTGCHSPSLSETLRRVLATDSARCPRVGNAYGGDGEERNTRTFADAIPEPHRDLFPQLRISSHWPPTVLCHGTADTAVPLEESRMLGRSLVNAGIPVKIFEFDGEEHSFDLDANAEDKHGKTFDRIMATLVAWVMD
jgi:acetyl esterase/lipase